jgi:hypothetical protein
MSFWRWLNRPIPLPFWTRWKSPSEPQGSVFCWMTPLDWIPVGLIFVEMAVVLWCFFDALVIIVSRL